MTKKPFKVMTSAAVVAAFSASAIVPSAVMAAETPAEALSVTDYIVEQDGKLYSIDVETLLDMKAAGITFKTTHVKASNGKVYSLDNYLDAKAAVEGGTMTDALNILAEDETAAEDIEYGEVVEGEDGPEFVDPETPGENEELVEAIEAAEAAINALPAVEELTLEDKAAVEEARALVDAAQAIDADAEIAGLDALAAAEAKIVELEEAVEELTVESVSAINAKTLEVTFNQEADVTAADFTVNKGTVKTNVASVAISEDKKTATIELTSKMTAGEYTVSVAQKDADALTGSVKVEDEKVADIKVLSEEAPFVDANRAQATVTVQVLNQYGEDITKLNYTDVTATPGGIATGASLDSEGKLTLTLPAGTAKDGDKAIITLVHAKTGVSTQATVTLSGVSAISEIAFGELYNKDGKTLNQDTDFAKDKFYVPVTTKDQYGTDVTDIAKINTEVIFTNTNPAIFTLDNSSKVKNVTINGKETAVLEISATNLAGSADIIAVSTTSGKSTKTSVTVEAGVTYGSVSIGAPTEVLSANKDAYFPLSVTDSNGESVLTKKAQAAIKQDTLTASTGHTIVELEGKEGLFVKVAKGDITEDKAITVVVTTKSGKVATQTVVAKAEAKPTVITGFDSKVSTALRANQAGVTIKNTDLVVEDQYGQVITDKAALGNILFEGSVEAGSASDAAFDIANASGDKAVTVKPKTNTAETTGKVTFKLKGVSANAAEASALTKTFTIVKDSQFESYTVADVPTIYAEETAGDFKVKPGYDQPIKVKATTASGEVVDLKENEDFTVTGKPAVGADVAFADKATTATKTVTITINATGEELTKELTYSNVAPKVAKVQLVKQGTVTEANGSAKADISDVKLEEVNAIEFTGGAAFDLASLAKDVDFVITDTYGVSVAVDEQAGVVATLKDGEVVSAQTITFSNGSEGVAFYKNGTGDARVDEYVVGSTFNSIVKFGGIAGNTVKATAKTADYSAAAGQAAIAQAKSALNTKISDATAASNGKTEGVAVGNQVEGSGVTLTSAIAVAQGVHDNAASTLQQLTDATSTLDNAITAYNNAVVADISLNLVAPTLTMATPGTTNKGSITGITTGSGETLNVTSATTDDVTVDAATGLALTGVQAGSSDITVQVKNADGKVIKTGTVTVTVSAS